MNFATLIPTSTAQVERSFSLMNLISVKLRKRLGQENLGHCMRISNYLHTLSDADYEDIYHICLPAEETKSGSRKVAAYVKDARAKRFYIDKYLKESMPDVLSY